MLPIVFFIVLIAIVAFMVFAGKKKGEGEGLGENPNPSEGGAQSTHKV